MSEEEMWEQMVQELRERRSNRKNGITKLTSTNTNGSYSVVNMDFASLYPSIMTMEFPSRQSRIKNKIKKIFP